MRSPSNCAQHNELEFALVSPAKWRGERAGGGTYRGDLAGLESLEDAVNLKFAVDVGILLLDVGGLVDVGSHDCECFEGVE